MLSYRSLGLFLAKIEASAQRFSIPVPTMQKFPWKKKKKKIALLLGLWWGSSMWTYNLQNICWCACPLLIHGNCSLQYTVIILNAKLYY